MAVIIHKKRWLRKPSYPVEVDPKFISDLDLRVFILFAEGGGHGIDLIRQRRATPVGATVAGWKAGPGGLSQNWGGSSSNWYERDTHLEPNVATWGGRVRRVGTLGSYSRPFGKTISNGGVQPYLSYNIGYNDNNSGQNNVNAWVATSNDIFGSGYHTSSGSINGTAGVDSLIEHPIYGRYNSETLDCFQNGKLLASNTTPSGNIYYDTTSTGRLILSGSSSAAVANAWNGDIYYFEVLGRALTDGEMRFRASEPYAILRPRKIVSYYFPTAGAPSAVIGHGKLLSHTRNRLVMMQ